MTIAQVLYVLEIADCRSISAAAERQFISQSRCRSRSSGSRGELGLSPVRPHAPAG